MKNRFLASRKNIYLLILLVFLVGFAYFRLSAKKRASTSQNNQVGQKSVTLFGQADIKREFEFPLQQSRGKSSLKFSLISAQLADTVANQGNPIQSNPDKQFLIIFLELQNNSQSPVQIDSRDFVRLIDKEEKKYAPDLYNGLIEIPAISVKKDEIGFMVAADQKQFRIQVGEIEKEKEIVEIIF